LLGLPKPVADSHAKDAPRQIPSNFITSYPAKRCRFFTLQCSVCGQNAIVTTAGRKDDPRSVKLACKIPKAVA
jgi:hypothetical protein